MTINALSKSTAAVLLILLVSAVACRRDSPSGAASGHSNASKLSVVATVGMVADVVRRVGGDHVDVIQLCGSGIDPHTHAATRDDVKHLIAADVVFYVGLHLEGRMSDKLALMAKTKPVIALGDAIDPSQLLAPEEFGGNPDPHVWMDVSIWSETIALVRDTLSSAMPEHTAEFEQNASMMTAELKSLNEYALRVIATIPESTRILVTSHDAFNYLGRAYNMRVEGIQGISTESEAGLRRINDLVDQLVEQQVPAVFVESSVNPKNIQALIEGAASRGHTVANGGELFSDAMGITGTYPGTYVGMIDHNVTTITRSLGGDAPAGGMNGKLAAVESMP